VNVCVRQIYFVGSNAKKEPGKGDSNNGYDDATGSYIHVIHDHIAYRYEVLKLLGKGSFGQVVKAYDHRLNTYVAVKIVRNEKRFHRQAQVRQVIIVNNSELVVKLVVKQGICSQASRQARS